MLSSTPNGADPVALDIGAVFMTFPNASRAKR
jgi:hypothetical protein